MKVLSERRALGFLRQMQDDFASKVRMGYEHKAASCITCKTPGACCLDAHFVNVRISRLEAANIGRGIDLMPVERQQAIRTRIDEAVDRYRLTEDVGAKPQKYACPLFEQGVGCTVQDIGKPAACVAHACYESPSDLPPDELLAEQELRIDALNERTYGRSIPWLPIPVALSNR